MNVISYFQISFEAWTALFCVIAGICVWASRQFNPGASMTLLGMLFIDAAVNISEIVYHYFGTVDTSSGRLMVKCAVFAIFLYGFLLAILTAKHIGQVVVIRGGEEAEGLTRLSVIFSGAGLCILLCSAVLPHISVMDSENHGYRQSVYSLLILLAAFAVIPILLQIIMNRSVLRPREQPAYILFCMMPLTGLFVQLFTPGVGIFNIANSLSLILLILIHQLGYTEDTIEHQKLLASEQLRLYTSQIQPHFIYNCLTTIRSYMPEDSEAREALNHFAGFLRGSLDLLMSTECIPAGQELKTVDNYIYMEMARYGDAVCVKREINDTDFKLPPFTVQFLVENAIRHGIRENPDGRGTLVVRSYQTDDGHVIEVNDDGPGFEPESVPEWDPDGTAHIGLLNVKKRLEIMCGGTLSLESEPGAGTRVKVFIPAM